MKALILCLIILLCVLQYKLWFEGGGSLDARHLKQVIAKQQTENEALRDRNLALSAEIEDLKTGADAIEERARTELGMIKKEELFYQIVS